MGFVVTPATAKVLRVAEPMFYSAIQISSVRTALQIAQTKNVGELSPVPFLSLLTNAVVNFLYGLLVKDQTLIVPNATAAIAGVGCVGTFLAYQQEKRFLPYAVSFTIMAFSCAVAAMGKRTMLGMLGCSLCIAMLASPLAVFGKVIRTKSTRSLPFSTSFNSWMNAITWSLFGLFVINDKFIYLPNMIGFVLASVQMLLFVIYGMPNKTEQKELF